MVDLQRLEPLAAVQEVRDDVGREVGDASQVEMFQRVAVAERELAKGRVAVEAEARAAAQVQAHEADVRLDGEGEEALVLEGAAGREAERGDVRTCAARRRPTLYNGRSSVVVHSIFGRAIIARGATPKLSSQPLLRADPR